MRPHRRQPTRLHHPIPPPGFSRQEHRSGLPFPSPMHESEKWKWSCSVVSDSGIFQAGVLVWGATAFSVPPFYRPLNFFTKTTQWILFSALQSHTNYLRGRFGCYWSPSKKQQRENGRGKADPIGSSTVNCTLSLRGSAPTHTLPCGHSLSEHREGSPDFKN